MSLPSPKMFARYFQVSDKSIVINATWLKFSKKDLYKLFGAGAHRSKILILSNLYISHSSKIFNPVRNLDVGQNKSTSAPPPNPNKNPPLHVKCLCSPAHKTYCGLHILSSENGGYRFANGYSFLVLVPFGFHSLIMSGKYMVSFIRDGGDVYS